MMNASDQMEETDCVQNILDNAGHTGRIPQIKTFRTNTESIDTQVAIKTSTSSVVNNLNDSKKLNNAYLKEMTKTQSASKDECIANSSDDTFSTLFASAGIKKNLYENKKYDDETSSLPNIDDGMEMTCQMPLLDDHKKKNEGIILQSQSPDGMEMTCRFPSNNFNVKLQKDMISQTSNTTKRCSSDEEDRLDMSNIPHKVIRREKMQSSDAIKRLVVPEVTDSLEVDENMEITCKLPLPVLNESYKREDKLQCKATNSTDMEMTCNVLEIKYDVRSKRFDESEYGKRSGVICENLTNTSELISNSSEMKKAYNSTMIVNPNDNSILKTKDYMECLKGVNSEAPLSEVNTQTTQFNKCVDDPAATKDMEITCKLPLIKGTDGYQNPAYNLSSTEESQPLNIMCPKKLRSGQGIHDISADMEMTCNLARANMFDDCLATTKASDFINSSPISCKDVKPTTSKEEAIIAESSSIDMEITCKVPIEKTLNKKTEIEVAEEKMASNLKEMSTSITKSNLMGNEIINNTEGNIELGIISRSANVTDNFGKKDDTFHDFKIASPSTAVENQIDPESYQCNETKNINSIENSSDMLSFRDNKEFEVTSKTTESLNAMLSPPIKDLSRAEVMTLNEIEVPINTIRESIELDVETELENAGNTCSNGAIVSSTESYHQISIDNGSDRKSLNLNDVKTTSLTHNHAPDIAEEKTSEPPNKEYAKLPSTMTSELPEASPSKINHSLDAFKENLSTHNETTPFHKINVEEEVEGVVPIKKRERSQEIGVVTPNTLYSNVTASYAENIEDLISAKHDAVTNAVSQIKKMEEKDTTKTEPIIKDLVIDDDQSIFDYLFQKQNDNPIEER